MFDIKKLSKNEISDYSVFLKKNENNNNRENLNNTFKEIYYAGIVFGVKAGIIKAFFNEEESILSIEHIFTIPKFRRKGLAYLLIEKIKDFAIKNKVKKINIKYFRTLGKTSEIDMLLKKTGFTKPQVINLSCFSDFRVLDSPWLINDELTEGFSYFLWKDLTEDIKGQIQNHTERHKWEDLMLEPLEKVENIEYTNSTGLLYKDQIAGWMICQRLNEDVVLYRNLYVLDRFRNLARGIQLLRHSIKLQKKTTAQHGLWIVAGNNSQMTRFVKQRMAPDCIYIKEEVGSYIDLELGSYHVI